MMRPEEHHLSRCKSNYINYVNALRLDQKQHVKLVHAANHIMSLFSSCATPEKPRIESETFHQTNWPLAAWVASRRGTTRRGNAARCHKGIAMRLFVIGNRTFMSVSINIIAPLISNVLLPCILLVCSIYHSPPVVTECFLQCAQFRKICTSLSQILLLPNCHDSFDIIIHSRPR